MEVKLLTSAAFAAALRGSAPLSVLLPLDSPNVRSGPPTRGGGFVARFGIGVCAFDSSCAGAEPKVLPGEEKESFLLDLPQRLPIL